MTTFSGMRLCTGMRTDIRMKVSTGGRGNTGIQKCIWESEEEGHANKMNTNRNERVYGNERNECVCVLD